MNLKKLKGGFSPFKLGGECFVHFVRLMKESSFLNIFKVLKILDVESPLEGETIYQIQ